MRSFFRLMPAILLASVIAIAPPLPIATDPSLPFAGVPKVLRQKRGKGLNNRRGKGQRNTPKARPNRLHISKRVRRKHRRAA